MIFLQEAISGGIYLVLLFFVASGLIIIAIIFFLNVVIKKNRKRKETEMVGIHKQSKGNEIPIYVNYTIAFVALALALVLLNWVCNIKFD